MKARGYDMICKVKGAFSLEILKLPVVGSSYAEVHIQFTGPEQSMKIDDRKINQSIDDN